MNDTQIVEWVAAVIMGSTVVLSLAIYWYLRPLLTRPDDDET